LFELSIETRHEPPQCQPTVTNLRDAEQLQPVHDASHSAVSSDDRRFLMIRPLGASAPEKLIVVENWFDELKAKARK
jgi:hypothetical protein